MVLVLNACGDDAAVSGDAALDAAQPAPDALIVDAGPVDAIVFDADPLRPQTLCATGLYAECASETVAPGVVAYAPQYELWSDGASKRRWVLLPEGSRIDTSDMDFWNYPVGTRVWKEFSRDGVRVETRLLFKTGPELPDWFMMAYAWSADQSEALAVEDGVIDALGTAHDIPEAAICRECHERQPDVLLGYGAIQLDHSGDGQTLRDLIESDRLSDPPSFVAAPFPYFEIPGQGTPARAALGYLHANCGGCHHERSETMDNTPLNLRLGVASLETVAQTPTYVTTVGVEPALMVVGATANIEPGLPEQSALHIRMMSRATIGMPPVGTDDVDADGVAILDAWIDALKP